MDAASRIALIIAVKAVRLQENVRLNVNKSMSRLLIGGGSIYKLNNSLKTRHFMTVTLISEITCPYCGFKKTEVMPTDACQFFYECTNCLKMLKPINGDCCVFCSFGSVKCPPVQENKSCCS
jgi:hypothetical protein